METAIKVVGYGVVALAMVVGVSIIMAYPTMWVVNDLFSTSILVSLFGVAKLTLWKSILLNFICGTLFKGSSSSSSKD